MVTPTTPVDLEALKPDPEQWLYARHREDEHWEAGGPTREDAIAEAFIGAEIGDVCYVVLGERPTTEKLAEHFRFDDVLETIIDSAEELLGEDTGLKFTDAAACEAELKAVIAKYLVRPNWWVCDGVAAEEVTFNGED